MTVSKILHVLFFYSDNAIKEKLTINTNSSCVMFHLTDQTKLQLICSINTLKDMQMLQEYKVLIFALALEYIKEYTSTLEDHDEANDEFC